MSKIEFELQNQLDENVKVHKDILKISKDIIEVNILSFFEKFIAFKAICNPAVQLDTATAYFDPTYFEIFFSNFAT